MSRRVIGYKDGHKVYDDEWPHDATDMTSSLLAVEKMTNRPRVAAVSRDRVIALPSRPKA